MEETPVGRVGWPDSLVPNVLTNLGSFWSIVEVAFSIKIEVDGMITKLGQEPLAVALAD